MSETKKSILAETLEDIQTVKQQIEENANFALSSTLKDELSEIVKNGLAESFTSDEETPEDVTADDIAVDSTPTGDADVTDELPTDLEAPADEAGEEGSEVIDLTSATPEEVIGSFKLMAPTDEIEIVRSEEGISINFSPEGGTGGDDAENAIDAATASIPGMETTDAPEMDAPAADDAAPAEPTVEPSDDDEEDKLYEIEITETDDAEEAPVEEAMSHHIVMKQKDIAHNGNDPVRVEEDAVAEEAPITEDDKEEVKESTNKLVAARKKIQALMLENKKIKTDLEAVTGNVAMFEKAENEYKTAISTLKNQLQEVALYTSNMTYAVKLMAENTTTKAEKIAILKRLDSAQNINESREVFKSLNESFKGAKSSNATQIIESKILGTEKTSGASKINESKVYSNPQVDRIKEIIGKITK